MTQSTRSVVPDAAIVAPPERCLLCNGRHQTHLRPDGRRMLTLEQAAIHLNTSKTTVRKLIREQRKEDAAAAAAGRVAKRVGLRVNRLSAHVNRILESDVVALLDR